MYYVQHYISAIISCMFRVIGISMPVLQYATAGTGQAHCCVRNQVERQRDLTHEKNAHQHKQCFFVETYYLAGYFFHSASFFI